MYLCPEQRHDPHSKKKANPNTTTKKKTSFHILFFIIKAVLLKYDHELGLNPANSQINSAKLIRKWKTSILIVCVILLVISTISFMFLFFPKAPLIRKEERPSPQLTTPLPNPGFCFCCFFFAKEEKPQSKENPKPNNQMSLDN